jgi:hypothetical protein
VDGVKAPKIEEDLQCRNLGEDIQTNVTEDILRTTDEDILQRGGKEE